MFDLFSTMPTAHERVGASVLQDTPFTSVALFPKGDKSVDVVPTPSSNFQRPINPNSFPIGEQAIFRFTSFGVRALFQIST